ncbi:polyhydroxyalkanoate synthesis repressor PhaR [Breoghania corrubedonensis]|uniref:Polyhydroxyalkanoate synthesis repressor PhaR n=1 Tax=Breoghania corrubedonensis TaxID=665038 RepID=A0A2T5VHT0_9HYPH|nr:polyhydroxyalkanoate synthesis repressor PhaR [Breoghania corrubedonensis]PTW63319.1 polyhydroxyalkanoate synthesis repressor PhaR [Breoghania corrubedonensis]
MAKKDGPTTIKKYANRRLYNTGTSTYVTLEDLALMVKSGDDFQVFDAKSGEDITRSVLTQIIFEQEAKGQNLLPVTFLRQLIRFYGDQIQTLVPSYLEYSMASLTKEQNKLREQMSQTFGTSAFDMMEEQVRRNTEIFERAMHMFMPFPGGADAAREGEPAGEAAATSGTKDAGRAEEKGDLNALKQQLADMQKKIDDLAKPKG